MLILLATFPQSLLVPNAQHASRATTALTANTVQPLSRASTVLLTAKTAQPLVLHAYEHCHFTTRTRLVLGWVGMPFECKFYGYGAGADPAKCEGRGHDPQDGGTVPLMGKKLCPVLTGDEVPTRDGLQGLGESMEICSYAAGISSGRLAPATGRADVSGWLDRVGDTRKALERPRLIRMPVPDFADARDVEYAKWTHTRRGFDYAEAEAATPQLLVEMQAGLEELATMLRGRDASRGGAPTLNAWGASVDDALVLPILRSLTCVRDLKWPPLVREYVDGMCEAAGVPLFTEHAS